MDLRADLHEIEANLSTLSDERVSKLTHLIEQSRDMLPQAFANGALDKMRPRLAVVRPPRRLTLQRLFCLPFEAVLYGGRAPHKRPGKIARHAIQPCWTFLYKRLDNKRRAGMEVELQNLSSRDEADIAPLRERLWTITRETLEPIIAKGGKDSVFLKTCEKELHHHEMDGDAVWLELVDMLGFLRIADSVHRLNRHFRQQPVTALRMDAKFAIVGELERVEARQPGQGLYLLYYLAAQLRDAAGVVALVENSKLGKTAKSEPLTRATQEIVLEDIAHAILDMSEVAPEKLSDLDVAEAGQTFLARLSSFREGLKDEKGNTWDLAIGVARENVRRLVTDNILSGAEDNLTRSLGLLAKPAREEAGGRSEQDYERLLAAENRVVALRKCARFAREVGLEKDVARKLEAMGKESERSAETLLKRVAETTKATLEVSSTEADLFAAIRIHELIVGPQAAEPLLRKGMAALEAKAG